MGQGIHARGHGNAYRQAQGQQRIVDHGPRQHLAIAPGALHAALGQAIDRRHFRTGIGGRHRDDRQAVLKRDGLAEAGGGAAADRNRAVGAKPLGLGPRCPRSLDRHVHDCFGVNAGAARAQSFGCCCRLVTLLRRGQHKRSTRAKPLHFRHQAIEGADPEDHPGQQLVIGEGQHAATLI
jgi:hypothetical protein